MTASAPPLQLDAVTAGYGPLVILDRLSLALQPDEILLVLGANGSGKSTLLKTAMGLTRLAGGRLALAGEDITAWPAHRRAAAGIGYVPQTGNVFAGLSVRDNLRMGAFLRPAAQAAAQAAVLDLFPRLAERLAARAGALSGGERRMLSIALTMMAEPRLLLLDEPSSDLAPAAIDLVFAAIDRIRRERRIPVLLVEQNVARGLALADRVVVMVRGRAAATMPVGAVTSGDLHALFLDGSVGAGGPSQP
ncbi:ABC transporter ATP-binding protein [Labrys wisconsinensis]|uniref:ABC-type branched-subunit amino acid transport system ATPase component n=1 Tax=Labrys wisconsinensis TaxID=425677 RepID=A0ABU0J914_9HYPH|nr:ATP-binding cassette domain-containing protein [Labrys wisconsinensis]MDQ0470772.1 ABC-type branched-subunit amino acid transport system ATPase component [Labrys wisconsinensis]